VVLAVPHVPGGVAPQDVVFSDDVDHTRQGEPWRRHGQRPEDRQREGGHREKCPAELDVDIGVPEEDPEQHTDDHGVVRAVVVHRQLDQGRMPGEPRVRRPLDVQVEGAFHGLQGQRVGRGRRDVLAGGGVEAREDQDRQHQTDRFHERGGAPTHPGDQRARSGPLDQAPGPDLTLAPVIA
jgi:hypothetical protein